LKRLPLRPKHRQSGHMVDCMCADAPVKGCTRNPRQHTEGSDSDGCCAPEDKSSLMAAAAFTAKRPFEAWAVQIVSDHERGDEDTEDDGPESQPGLVHFLLGLRRAEARGARPLGCRQRRRQCRQEPHIGETAPDSSDCSSDELADKQCASGHWRFTDFLALAEKAASTPQKTPQRRKRRTPVASPSAAQMLRPIDVGDEETAITSDEEDSRPALRFGDLLRGAFKAESRGAAPLKRLPLRPKLRQSGHIVEKEVAAIGVSIVEPDSSDDG